MFGYEGSGIGTDGADRTGYRQIDRIAHDIRRLGQLPEISGLVLCDWNDNLQIRHACRGFVTCEAKLPDHEGRGDLAGGSLYWVYGIRQSAWTVPGAFPVPGLSCPALLLWKVSQAVPPVLPVQSWLQP